MTAGSYWNHQGLHQAKYEQLKALIPHEGKSCDAELEALRCVSNYYYDVHNNGAANIKISLCLSSELMNRLRAAKIESTDEDTQPFMWNENLDSLVDRIILRAWEKHGQVH